MLAELRRAEAQAGMSGNPAEEAAQMVAAQFGAAGPRALAAFMHAGGSETVLTFPDETWPPCDVVTQHAWAFGRHSACRA